MPKFLEYSKLEFIEYQVPKISEYSNLEYLVFFACLMSTSFGMHVGMDFQFEIRCLVCLPSGKLIKQVFELIYQKLC